MQKIMFNDRYGLTEAVLEGRKTQTRRVISVNFYNRVDWKYFEEGHNDCIIDDDISILDCGQYHVGEVVAIAQAYNDVYDDSCDPRLYSGAGWTNKLFVKAELMPNHIKITNIRVERLQDISDEDCLKEGIDRCEKEWGYWKCYKWGQKFYTFETKQKAFASLIDKVGKKGTWDKNPYVFVYDFELVD